jgi:hypothetical protein
LTDRILQPRTRILNFRVTEDEYQQIREASRVHGSRGISDYARWATLDSMRNPNSTEHAGDAGADQVIKWLDKRLTSFESTVLRMFGKQRRSPS